MNMCGKNLFSAMAAALLFYAAPFGALAAEEAFEEIVVADTKECTIKITGIEEEEFFGYTLIIYLENKTQDKDFIFSVENVSINNVCIDSFFAADVTAGKKISEQVTFFEDELEKCELEKATDIELRFVVYDADNWDDKPAANEVIHVYPYGKEKAVSYERPEQETDIVLADNENVKVVAVGTEEDPFGGCSLKLYIENKTDSPVVFNADEISINGYTADDMRWEVSIDGGKIGFKHILWPSAVDVENIEFNLDVCDAEDETSYISEVFTIAM